ncbi:MAG: hypothetical protein K0U68_01585 [Gammaproteobacteria bacterium]|nr:hypothetical protein [Gammaproteobacteria bacterium]
MKLVVSLVLFFSIQICLAQRYSLNQRTIYPKEYDISDVVAETFFLRPLGFIGSIAGSAVFLGSLPLSAFASIAPPHDAINKAADTLIIGPANATFKRPFAFYHYSPVGNYPKVIEHEYARSADAATYR